MVPQIALVLGQCGGIASAIAGMSDFVIMSKNGSLFVNGPQVVSAAAGKQLDMETIGGRGRFRALGHGPAHRRDRRRGHCHGTQDCGHVAGQQPGRSRGSAHGRHNRTLAQFETIDTVSDVREVLRAVADLGDIVEMGEEFAPSMVTALGKIGGTTVGFIANQPSKDEGRLTVYGCKKAARFASFCDCFSIPIISVVDSMGMKISTAPQGELSRAGAQLLFALSEASTPRIALVTGQAIGMSYAAMASRAAADVVYAWPGSVFSAVSAPIAAQLLYADEMKDADDPYAKRAELEQRYMDDVADAVNAAKQGYVDDRNRARRHPPDALRSRGDARGQARYEARQEARHMPL